MSAAPQKLLLVGAGGFVGPWLARAALAAGWAVTGLSRRATDIYGPGYIAVAADATDVVACRPYVEAADAVIYNAAYIPANYSDATEAADCLSVNAQAPLAMLGLLAARPRPFVYISGAQGYVAAGRPASEGDPVFPSGHAPYYLSSKLLGDIFTEHYRLVHGVPTAVLRFGSLYGPGLKRGMVAHFVEQARTGRRITLQNGGRHQADLTFVGDAGFAVTAVLERRAEGIFNIGSGCATSTLEAAQLVATAAGRSYDILEIEPIGKTTENSGFAALNIARAKRELGYEPTTPAAGLDRTVNIGVTQEWMDIIQFGIV